MEPEIKVTRIANRWHARLWRDGVVLDHMACETRLDIGWICREMLRWYDKSGGCSEFASRARQRHQTPPVGRIWYWGHLLKNGK